MGYIDPKRPELGELPEWHMQAIFPAPDSAEYQQALRDQFSESVEFAKNYYGKVSQLATSQLLRAIEEYEVLLENSAHLSNYMYMHYARDQADAKIGQQFQSVQEMLTKAGNQLLFFTLELNKLDDSKLNKHLNDGSVKKYAPWLRDLRAGKPHELSEDMEKLLAEKAVAGNGAWVRLYDQLTARLRFQVDNEELTLADVRQLVRQPDRRKREAAARALQAGLAKELPIFTHIFNTLIKDKEIEDRWRGFTSPMERRYKTIDYIEPEVVEALVSAAKAAYPRISHRYYRLKARLLGLEKLQSWDTLAPLPGGAEASVPWAEARELVESVYDKMSPTLGRMVRGYLAHGHVDAPAKAGKYAGAFAISLREDSYLLMNYTGKADDVLTLAHELGHCVHGKLSFDKQGYLCTAGIPYTLAETASVFGEMIAFKELLARAKSPEAKRAMLAMKIEDMMNTVLSITARFEFDKAAHLARRDHELMSDELDELWRKCNREWQGDGVEDSGVSRHNWASIPHFFHWPFYNYPYAFGDCLTNALYSVWQQQPEGFVEKYMQLLSAGATLRHKDLVAPFGLDTSDPAFWARGLKVLEGMVDELEGLCP